VEVTFLAYVLNIIHRFVMHNNSYANVVECTAYLYSICVVCISVWTVDTGVVMQLGACRGTGNGECNFMFLTNPVLYVHKIIEHVYEHLFICHSEFINFVTTN
jgi:hypothetical protein